MKEELRNGFQQELLALKMERQSQYRQMLESKHLANAVSLHIDFKKILGQKQAL